MFKLKQVVSSYLSKFVGIATRSSTPVLLASASAKSKGENDPGKQKYTRRPKTTNNIMSRHTASGTGNTSTLNGSSTSSTGNCDRIVWMDLEMTGLDITKDVIMEVGCIITEQNLEEVARLPEIVINVPGTLLDSMDAWCMSTHGGSGLTEGCRNSAISNLEAEDKILQFLQQYTESGVCPMGGNSITYDRIFLKKYMPRVEAQLHYRNIDVSTIKELVRRWYPKEYTEGPQKRFTHRTMSDIEDSINELKYYRSKIFVPPRILD